MFLLMVIFVALAVVAARYPELPLGRMLHKMMIAGPAAWLTDTPPRRRLIGLAVLLGLFLLLASAPEIAPMLAAADITPFLMAADLSLYLDIMLLSAVALAALRIKTVGRLILRMLGQAPRARPARGRSSGPRRAKRPPPANDDAPGFAFAA